MSFITSSAHGYSKSGMQCQLHASEDTFRVLALKPQKECGDNDVGGAGETPAD
jgi:hypothetical protein